MKTCSFFGHRNTEATPELCSSLKETLLYLITKKDVRNFLFGSKSKFDSLCFEIVTELKEQYPKINRIYVRSHFPYIDKSYKNYLLESFEDTYIPSKVINAGRASYVERNQEMINKSDFCVFYYDTNYIPSLKRQKKTALLVSLPKSGTKLAYEYAIQQKKQIINLYK